MVSEGNPLHMGTVAAALVMQAKECRLQTDAACRVRQVGWVRDPPHTCRGRGRGGRCVVCVQASI